MTGNVVFAGFAAVGAPGFSLSSSSSRSPSGRLHAPSSLVAQSLRSLAPQSRRHGRPCGSLGSAPSARALPASPGASHGTAAIAGGAFGPAVTGVLAALLAVALGVQNAKARKLAVPDMTTTVLTMTLTGLAADFRAAFCAGSTERAKARTTFSRRLIVIGTMLAGAVASAALVLGVSPLSALAVATALLASVAAAAALAARHPAAWRVPATR
jgi:uncharacterized membrane protein YoaK (UPF0700 family)